ncbi:MAG TPA: CsgG/HfaB family protein [Rhizomicrobium sp.]|jgi:curli biogenesis system outer membrane secretion channel CsgG
MRIAKAFRAAVLGAITVSFTATTLATPAGAEDAYQKQQRKEGEIPHCATKKGTLAVYEPQNNWWQALGLESPEALIKVIVMQSGCFTLLDRGKGFDVAQRERALSSGGELQQGSNIGKGQVKAADYVMVPDIVSKNGNSGGTNIGGALGGLFGHSALGGIVGGISINSKTADVVLTITNVRTSEQEAMEQGHGSKTDVGWGGGAGFLGPGWGAGMGVSSYTNSEIGQVVVLAYIDAYTKLVGDLGLLSGNASAAAPTQAVTTSSIVVMHETASPSSKAIKKIQAGALLYPTGNKDGVMWEVKDELGVQGWVSSNLIALAK